MAMPATSQKIIQSQNGRQHISESQTEDQCLYRDLDAVEVKELIPKSVGGGSHRKRVQHRTLTLWTLFAIVGLLFNKQQYYPLSAKARAAALSLLFPGAGYIASANVVGTVLFVVTYLLLPFTLLAVSA